METKKVILKNESGLHARPASELAKIASKYQCTINLIVNGKIINPKSILNIISVGIKTSSEIGIQCDGEDEKKALLEIEKAFKNNFGE